MTAETDFVNAVRQALTAYDVAMGGEAPPLGSYDLALVGDSRLVGNWNAILGRTDIINLAVNGQRAYEWRDNWQANVQSISATGVKKVIVQFGKNDIDAGRTAAQIAHDLQDIVTLIGTYTGARVGVLAPLPVAATAQNAAYTNQITAQLAATPASAIPAQLAGATPPGIWYQGYQDLVDASGNLIATAGTDGAHLDDAHKIVYAASITTLEGMIPAAV